MTKETININGSIKYKGKLINIPPPFNQCYFGAEPTKLMTIHNRFSDETFTQSCKLPAFAVAIYDTIMGSQQIASNYDQTHGDGSSPLWKTVRKGLDWFRKYFAKEYMVLLD